MVQINVDIFHTYLHTFREISYSKAEPFLRRYGTSPVGVVVQYERPDSGEQLLVHVW